MSDKLRSLSARFYAENKRLATRKSIVSTLLFLISSAGYYAAYSLLAEAHGKSNHLRIAKMRDNGFEDLEQHPRYALPPIKTRIHRRV
jgi:hypothetical protein